MVEVKREDITLSDWTKGISVDEFAWGSYFFWDNISSGYSTKGFELGYWVRKTAINNREDWYSVALAQVGSGWLATFTRDGKIELNEKWNSLIGTGDDNRGWALYSFFKPWTLGDWYLNGLRYWDYLIGIYRGRIDVIDYNNLFDPDDEILTNTDMSDSTWWTLGTGWSTTDDGLVHESWETGTLTSDITSAWLTNTDYCRLAIKISGWTHWALDVTIWNNTETCNDQCDWWLVENLKGAGTTTTLTITPTEDFDWVIRYINLHKYNNSSVKTYSIDYSDVNAKRPALIWEWDLYIGNANKVNIVSLTDWWVVTKRLIDANYTIVDITQQAWNLIIWATDWADSRQYYWNGVDAVATEVIEWKWLIIQDVAGTETISYVLTTSGATSGTITGYEYRLYAVSWYQRSLIASKLFDTWSDDYVDGERYNANKKFDFNDVRNVNSMKVFLDSLYIPGADGLYKYGNDIWGLGNAWIRPVRYDTWATQIVLGQSGHFLGIGLTASNVNYISRVDNRIYASHWYLVTTSIYRDRLSTRKSLEKLKIWYKNVASSVGNIKLYIIADDNYFWRFAPTSTPTTRPAVWDVYEVANDTTARVISVADGIITLVTVENGGSYNNQANTTLTKVSWEWDDSIAVGYNFDNMCLVKTIESANQCYGSDFIFGKDFVKNNIPYRHKIQFVIELNSNDSKLSPEVYELSIHADIDDVVL